MSYSKVHTPFLENNSREFYHFIKQAFTPYFTIEEYLKSNSIKTVSMYSEGTLAAVSFFIVRKDEICCAYTFVKAEARRQGRNSALKLFVEEYARKKGIFKFVAHVREQNIASLNTLLSLGYTVDTSENLFYSNGDKKLTLRKLLD